MNHTVRVWDLPTRLFHWALAATTIGLVISAKLGGNAMLWHFRCGYVVLALLLFRLVWGLVGGYWSRFTTFIYPPTRLWNYLRGQGQAVDNVGHNPLGALSVFALLVVVGLQVLSGLCADDEIAFAGPLARWISSESVNLATSYHKTWGQYLIFTLVGLHLLAIVFYVGIKKHNLVQPMVLGDKQLSSPAPSARDDASTRWAALAIALACGAIVAGGVVQLGA